ncbi:MAG: response regulator [Methylococcales bacterium]
MQLIEDSVEIKLDKAQLILFTRYVKIISATILAITLLVFISWFFNIDFLKSANPALRLMKLQAAFCFVFIALSLYLLTFKEKLQGTKKRLFYFSSLVIALESLLVILEYATGVDLVMDLNGSMTLLTAINFLFCSVSLLTVIKLPHFALRLIVIPLIISYIIFLNYLFGETAYLDNPLISMRLPTTFCFLLFTVGFFLLNLENSLLWFVTAKIASAKLCKRLLLLLFVLIPFIGWLRLQGQIAGWYDLGFGLSLHAAGMILSVSYLIIWSTKKIKTIELKALIVEKEKDLLLKIIEESRDFIGMADLNGSLGYHNPAAKRMLGFPENTNLSQFTIKSIFSDEEYKQQEEEVIPTAIKQGYWKGEASLLHHEGYEIPVSLICICHKDKQGNPVSLSAIMRDINEEKKLRNLMEQAEKKAVANEFRWKFAVEGSGDGLWDWNAENNEVFYSKKWKSMIGFADDEIENIFEEWEKRLHPDDKSDAMLDINNYLDSKTEHYSNEHRLLCKDGTYKWILSRGVAVSRDEEGNPLRLIGTHTDISERKNVEQVLREAKRTAELLAVSKANFLANMSHEIRTPMNAILGLSFVLEKSQLSEDDKSLIHKIQGAGKSLLGIINQVLDISKIEAGKLELEVATFNLHDILDNLATIMTFSADGKNLDLIIHPPTCYCVHRLKGDAPRLQQVLVNLVSNAIKFTHQGQVTVIITEQDINEQRVYLNFAVSDTGEGISKELQDTIFMPFSQADNSIARRYGGTGLGLSISRQLVNLMGADIVLSSEIGKGSCFSFGLIFDIALEVDINAVVENQGVEVIIADDNEAAREALLSMTKIIGLPALAIDSGQAVLNYVLNHQADVNRQEIIILDWKMPDMDGLQTAKVLYENRQTENKKPIIILETVYETKLRNEYPEAALIVDTVLRKPITASSLAQAIEKAMLKHGKTESKKRLSTMLPLKHLKGITLLVVDDNYINLEVASRIFRAEGALVISMDNGQKAVDYLKNNLDNIDLVLMDIQMPVMDGYEATRLIRQMPELIDLPIIALSAGAFKTQIEKAKSVGINDFIAKPFDVEMTVNLIAKLTKKTASVKINQENLLIEKPLRSAIQYSGIDIEAALETWGDVDMYKRYLVKFLQDCESLTIISNTRSEEFTSLIHKIKGTAKMLGLIEISNIVHEVDELIDNNQDTTEILGRLKIAIEAAHEAAQNFSPDYASAKQTIELAVKDFNGKIISELLTVVLQTVERDSPDGLTATLNELSDYLTAERIEPLKLALDFFDFPLAKSEIIKLANECDLSLGAENV